MSKPYVSQVISAARAVDNLVAIATTPLPSNESVARPLTQLSPDQQREVWSRAVENSSKGPPPLTEPRKRQWDSLG